jgi:hypothetical protein
MWAKAQRGDGLESFEKYDAAKKAWLAAREVKTK